MKNQNVAKCRVAISWHRMYSVMENQFQYKQKWNKVKLVIIVCSFICRQHQFKRNQIMMKNNSSNTTMYQGGQQHAAQSLMDIMEQQPYNSNVDNDVENRHNE